jgi:hypothetical protein
MMTPADVIGRTITAILRDQGIRRNPRPDGPDCTATRDIQFYGVFLELDGTGLLELGEYRKWEPLKFVDKSTRSQMGLLPEVWFTGDCPASCVGERIVNVLVCPDDAAMTAIILSSGRYLWLCLDVNGTEVALSTEEHFAYIHGYRASEMLSYWQQE